MTQPSFSATQLDAAKRLCAATFTHRHRYNRFLFAGGLVRTFMVRTCMPATDKVYVRVLRQDPCSFCGAKGRHVSTIASGVTAPRTRKQKQDLLNVTATCESCGVRKRDTPLLYFMLEQTNKTVSERSTRELLGAVIEQTEKRGSRIVIRQLAKRALEAFDRETDRAST